MGTHGTQDAGFSAPQNTSGHNIGCLKTALLMLLTVVVSVAVTIWLLTVYIFPKRFEPVELSLKEESVLQEKLARFEGFGAAPETRVAVANKLATGDQRAASQEALPPLQAEAYSEVGAKREIGLTERELNAILAKNTDLADKLAIDLADRLVSARLRLPMDPDFPFLGGKILRARAGVEFAYENARPVVVLKGISVMGVPIPNAWLGGIKNIDLVREFGQDEGFWKSFAEGVEDIQVVEGELLMKLRE